ncbi:hypothetical protein J1N35_003277 [Gossypium stocksii]|uniref:Reverse transcriptase zinc-binding domain-containing protein n=1 Tax=Gossypium stocksii TaxID=47602 RepID=A0A9D4AQ51_9ROSI|nr:hypothetical protein J1N35_003277 [Gossypium stocksii]
MGYARVVKREVIETFLSKPTVGQAAGEDIIGWGPSSSGFFTLASVYNLTLKRIQYLPYPNSEIWIVIWKAKLPPKLKFFLWNCGLKALPMKLFLVCRGWGIADQCSFCSLGQKMYPTLTSGLHLCGFLNGILPLDIFNIHFLISIIGRIDFRSMYHLRCGFIIPKSLGILCFALPFGKFRLVNK